MADRGVPGNSMEEGRQQAVAWARIGRGVTLFDYLHSTGFRGQVELDGFAVRAPNSENREWLIILRGYDHEGAPVVGFHSGINVGEAIAGAAERVQNGTIKWKPDQYRT